MRSAWITEAVLDYTEMPCFEEKTYRERGWGEGGKMGEGRVGESLSK